MIIILEKVTTSVRGELTRWLIEPFPCVFVGRVSGLVRDKLWEKCCNSTKIGGVVQAWATNTEQGYKVRVYGETSRSIVDMEGLQLVRLP
ncbi:MAG: type I-E CRISPR-associated endoribonuclease Cas2e [Anaerolineales bacterium]